MGGTLRGDFADRAEYVNGSRKAFHFGRSSGIPVLGRRFVRPGPRGYDPQVRVVGHFLGSSLDPVGQPAFGLLPEPGDPPHKPRPVAG